MIMYGALVGINKGRGNKMASWIEETRTTPISDEQLKMLGLYELQGSHIIAVSCYIRAKIDEKAQEAVTILKDNCVELERLYSDERVWFTMEKCEVAQMSRIIFREINMEHKGHNIAQWNTYYTLQHVIYKNDNRPGFLILDLDGYIRYRCRKERQ